MKPNLTFQSVALTLTAVLLLTAAACGGVGGSQGGLFAAKCELSCRVDDIATKTCGTVSPAQCQRDCEIVTAGLSTACGQCVVDNSYAGSTRNPNAAADAGSYCYYYEIGRPTSSSCASFCQNKDGGI